MKYKLFQGWWVRFYFCCALMMSTIVGVLVFAVWAGEDMILWGMGLAGLCSALAVYDFHAEKIADICCDGTVSVLRLLAYAP